ncbi:MAG: protein translocase subunit SecD [Phascolarctobacterium sp.]|nr:protein translocase subunit SecD [Phascolarctobacterium sp.]
MRWNELGKFLIIALAIIGGFCVYINPLANSIKQGLDLQGGSHVVLQAVETPEFKVDDDAVNRSVKIIERRINGLGLTEPVIQRQGKDRIIVELPGVKDPENAIAMLGRTALMQFKDDRGNVVLTGKDLKDARAQVGQGNAAVVGLEFNDEGAKKFAELTARNIGRTIAIELDGKVLTAPVVQEAITGGRAQISGQRSVEEAEQLAILLRSGSLPVKIEVLENRTVGPTLGQDSKEKSIKAFLIGIAAIYVFMLVFYRLSGIVADIALLLYVMLLLVVMRYLGATLTLPGIAGIILSIGMAVDANVLIFERFKEEVRKGKTLRSAMASGFSRAIITILDSNITTLMAAAILFYLGTGPIKGFAVTLALGTLLSMFTAVTVTKFLLQFLVFANFTKNPAWFGISAPDASAAKVEVEEKPKTERVVRKVDNHVKKVGPQAAPKTDSKEAKK